MTDALSSILIGALNERNNPTDLKPSIIGQVVSLMPLTVSLEEGRILLTEGSELFISEWFRFRCEIDKTKLLSQTVMQDCSDAESITETHSYTSSPCTMPNAITLLTDAIISIKNELFALKCDLKIGDLVCIESLEQKHKYLVIDKVINDVSD